MCLIHVVDRMAVVQELMAVKQFKNCKALSDAYVLLIHAKAHCYQIVRVVFDNYSVEGSLKETTRERRRVGKKSTHEKLQSRGCHSNQGRQSISKK